MPALAEVPDGNGEYLPQGNRLLRLETMGDFMRDLRQTIVNQLLDGRERYCEILDGRRVIFRLPQANQLHDFVSFQVDDHSAYGVTLMIPATSPRPDGKDEYDVQPFWYMPSPPDYYPKLSDN